MRHQRVAPAQRGIVHVTTVTIVHAKIRGSGDGWVAKRQPVCIMPLDRGRNRGRLLKLLHLGTSVAATTGTSLESRSELLVGVAVAAGPDLELLAVGGVARGEVEAETLAGEGEAVVVGVEPLLLLEARVAGPDLDERAVLGV